MKKIYTLFALFLVGITLTLSANAQALQGSSLSLTNGSNEFKLQFLNLIMDSPTPVISAPGWSGVAFYNPNSGQYDNYLGITAGTINLRSSVGTNMSSLGSTGLFFSNYSTNTNGVRIYAEGNATFNGKITAKEVEIKLNVWADYVFNKNYKLMPLTQLGSYINRHNHLPNIPTTQEVMEKNVNVGEMQAKLLEKIEELTLYILEQEKRIKALESQLNATSKN
jgi:hypothetical protein